MELQDKFLLQKEKKDTRPQKNQNDHCSNPGPGPHVAKRERAKNIGKPIVIYYPLVSSIVRAAK